MSFWEVTLELLKGFQTTVVIFAGTLAAALPLGLVVCFGSMCRFAPLRWLTRTFIWIIRGTPLMLQIIVVYYLPGLAFGIPVQNRMGAVLAAFIINYAAYFSEIYRGGIEGISTRISWEQTPRGRNVYVMVEISSFHDIARLGYHIPPGMARGGTI